MLLATVLASIPVGNAQGSIIHCYISHMLHLLQILCKSADQMLRCFVHKGHRLPNLVKLTILILRFFLHKE